MTTIETMMRKPHGHGRKDGVGLGASVLPACRSSECSRAPSARAHHYYKNYCYTILYKITAPYHHFADGCDGAGACRSFWGARGCCRAPSRSTPGTWTASSMPSKRPSSSPPQSARRGLLLLIIILLFLFLFCRAASSALPSAKFYYYYLFIIILLLLLLLLLLL